MFIVGQKIFSPVYPSLGEGVVRKVKQTKKHKIVVIEWKYTHITAHSFPGDTWQLTTPAN